MEMMRIKTAYCSGDGRNDVSREITDIVVILVQSFPKDTIILGRILPQSRIRATDESSLWWLLGYSLRFHMVFAQVVTGKHPSPIMCEDMLLRTVKGAKCTFNIDTWRASVSTDKYFHELDRDSLSDEAVVASLLTDTPEKFNLELAYTKFKLEQDDTILLPYISEWIELDILSGVRYIDIPDGVKHIDITSSISEPLIRLPDSVISCHIDRNVSVNLSIPCRFAKNWGYWSAIWGKPYMIKEGFSCSPDGLVVVRP